MITQNITPRLKICLSLLLTILFSASAVASDKFVHDGLEYTIVEHGKSCSLTGWNNNSDTAIIIPETIKENGEVYTVISIASEAFCGDTYLTELTIPSSVKSIGMDVFKNTTGPSIHVPSAKWFVELDYDIPRSTIEKNQKYNYPWYDSSFYVNGQPTNIYTVENGVVTIPEGVERIGAGKFYNRTDIRGFIFPSTLREFGEAAFARSGLKQFIVPETVNEIPAYLCYFARELKDIVLHDGITTVDDYGFAYYDYEWKGGAKINLLPKSLKYIGKYAFRYNVFPESASLPASLKKIGENAFAYCYLPTEIIIPEGTTIIDSYAFRSVKNTQKVTIKAPLTNLNPGVFSHNKDLKSVVIPNTITVLGGNIKYDTEINEQSDYWDSEYWYDVVGDNDGPFESCTQLENINLENVKIIKDGVFSNCTNFKQPLPNTLEEVGYYSFYQTGYTSLTIPASLKIMKEGAFNFNQKCEVEFEHVLEPIIFVDNPNTTNEPGYRETKYVECKVFDNVSKFKIRSLIPFLTAQYENLENGFLGNSYLYYYNYYNIFCKTKLGNYNILLWDNVYINGINIRDIKHLDIDLTISNSLKYRRILYLPYMPSLETMRIKAFTHLGDYHQKYDYDYIKMDYDEYYYNDSDNDKFYDLSDKSPNLKQLYIDGTFIIERGFYVYDNLQQVYVPKMAPPVAYENSFRYYKDKTLIIPMGTKDYYENVGCWSQFGNYEESDFSDVDAIFAPDYEDAITGLREVIFTPSENVGKVNNDIYTLHGVCLKRNATDEDVRVLPAGMYIIRGKKTIIK